MRHLILCYHAISDSWPTPLAISRSQLKAQISFLERRGYSSLTLSDWERRRAAGQLPSRSVVITFDDGYRSTLAAREVMEPLGFTGTVFPVVTALESGRRLSWKGIDQWQDSPHAGELDSLDWAQLEDLIETGWEVGSHTVTHPDLTRVQPDQLDEELSRSKLEIERRLGTCDSIAFPYGLTNPAVSAAAERAGYLTACTLTRFNHRDGRFARGRIGIYPADTGLRMRVKFSPLFSRFRRSRLAATTVGDG